MRVCATECCRVPAHLPPSSRLDGRPACSATRLNRSPYEASADELVDEVDAQPVLLVVGTALVDPREHVVIADRVAVRVDIDHCSVHLEQRDHLLDMLVDHQSVRLAGRLVDVASLASHPVMLEIAPLALEHEA